jgi:hypothetical protein
MSSSLNWPHTQNSSDEHRRQAGSSPLKMISTTPTFSRAGGYPVREGLLRCRPSPRRGQDSLWDRKFQPAVGARLQAFLLELGGGFVCSVTVPHWHRIQGLLRRLGFLHLSAKMLVLFDLKSGELIHHDIEQMDNVRPHRGRSQTARTTIPSLG